MKPNLKRIILSSVILILFVCAIYFIKSNQKPLNLVIISMDTLRADHMGVYGYSKNTTPNIDKWAKDASVFTAAQTVVPMTYPSFTALMTGRDPFHTRIIANNGLPISANTPTIATILKNNGYKTAAFVTNAIDVSQGFEEFNTHAFKIYYSKDKKLRFKKGSQDAYEKFILQSEDWLKNNGNNKFFLWVHLMDPHEPFFPPQDLRCKFDPKYCGQISGKTADDLDALRAEYESCQQNGVPADRVGLMQTLYDGEIAAGDRIIGKILDRLKDLGLDKNTVVVFYGDHGEGFDHNYYFNHREVLYNSAVRIPLIIKDPTPGSKRGFVNSLVQNIDAAPTLLDILGIGHKERFDGTSFANLTKPFVGILSLGRTKKYAYSVNSSWTKFSITDGIYKYIYSLSDSCLADGQKEELYTVKSDPDELKNLAKEEPKIKDILKKALFNYLSIYNLPIENKNIDTSHVEVDQEGRVDVGKSQEIKDLGY